MISTLPGARPQLSHSNQPQSTPNIALTLERLEATLKAVKSADASQLLSRIDDLAHSLSAWQALDPVALKKNLLNNPSEKAELQAQFDRMLAVSREALYTLDELLMLRQQRLAAFLPQHQIAYSAQGRLSTPQRT